MVWRLSLAAWLTAAENPLLARVTVNRIWQQFFGVGLVKTVDNFGVQGETPSKPELLDWLAADFRESGWDLHHLIPTIVLSSTYRQSSRRRLELEDFENRLLARGASFCLPAEMIRDQALAVSGLLTRQVGGPSVKPYQPSGIWEDVNAPAGYDEVYEQDSGGALYRKSMYIFWRRAAMHPAMAVFDAPSRDMCSVLRSTTNTPLQALALQHAPTYIEAARKLAERIIKSEPSEHAMIVSGMRRTLSRSPTKRELALLSQLYHQRLDGYAADPAQAAKLLQVGESTADPKIDAVRLAAMSDVCLAIFNLSETIMRK
ncbi:MAG: DUF1553 domain-containing protein [Pirellulaceae bacterium]|nr:DUF1553 domain-containing protein [Pirellulaceae bacterium]